MLRNVVYLGMEKKDNIEVGDKVRFVCEATDGDGFHTGKIMDITGVLTEIELNHIDSPHFPKYHVTRKGKEFWYFGDNIELIQKAKSPKQTG